MWLYIQLFSACYTCADYFLNSRELSVYVILLMRRNSAEMILFEEQRTEEKDITHDSVFTFYVTFSDRISP